MNWPKIISNGVKFAIIRSSNGLYKNTTSSDGAGRDKMLLKNAQELTTTTAPWAIYHYVQGIHDIEQQIALVVSILDELKALGASPKTAQFSDGRFLPRVFLDVEELSITNSQIKFFVDGLAAHGIGCGIYTRKNIWEPITNGVSVWWSDLMLWLAAYGVNDGKIPNFTPALPRGWIKAHIWQYTSLGGFEVGHTKDSLDVNVACLHLYASQPTPPPTPEPPPIPAPAVDISAYFVPASQYGPKIVMKIGSGTQPMQLEKRASDVILRKGDGFWIDGKRYQDSEQWRVKDGQVQKGKDTSDSGNNGKDGYDLGWVQWIPQFVSIGKTYNSKPLVRRFDRTNNCQVYSESAANDYLYIKEIVPTWISPANSSIVLKDVLVIEWRSGTSNLSTPPNETYYFAKGMGYCGWGNHFIIEITQGQSPLVGALDCGMI